MCCSTPPACSSTPLQPFVHYPSISLENIICIQSFCELLNALYIFDQTDLYRFEVRLELYGANTHLVVGPPSLSPPTPPPSRRWAALTTLPPLAKFQLVWCRSCEALLSSSSLAVQKRPSLLSCLCLNCRRYRGRFALSMKIKLSIIYADTVDALTATFAI